MVFNIFSTCVKYQFKCTSRIVHIVVLIITIAAVIIPIMIIRRTGGFWVTDWSRIEKPLIDFKYRYLLIAERDVDNEPIICSSFQYYKGSRISDDCTLIKIHETDTNKDGQKEVLKFEARFFSDQAIKVLRLFLLFGCELRDRVQIRFDTPVTMDHNVVHEAQEIQISGTLLLLQKGALESHYNYVYSSDKINYNGHPLSPMSPADFTEMFSATIANTRATWKSGFAKDEEIVIKCEIFYDEQTIHYRLGVWEQYKWAWIQYLSIFVVLLYFAKYLVSTIVKKKSGHVVVPWKKVD